MGKFKEYINENNVAYDKVIFNYESDIKSDIREIKKLNNEIKKLLSKKEKLEDMIDNLSFGGKGNETPKMKKDLKKWKSEKQDIDKKLKWMNNQIKDFFGDISNKSIDMEGSLNDF